MKRLLQSKHLPLIATTVVFVLLFATAAARYEGFLSLRVLVNLFGDNAFLGIAAVGMTFVILSGGIDLSVGAVMAFSTIFVATLVGSHGVHPLIALTLAVLIGTLFGAAMGWLIHRYALPPFLVTLGGMFFARGMAFAVSPESVGISHSFYRSVLNAGIPLAPGVTVPPIAIVFLVVFVAAVFVAEFTPFGRNIYAVGGSEQSARLMGLPIGATKVAVYTLNGFCSALAGVVATFFMGSGNPAIGFGLELDAIASVVIGGTLLSGGVGTIVGTLIGVLIFGTIQMALVFDGRLNSWWLRIAVGLLLMLFILLQRLMSRGAVVRR
jgi:galactofuranose transport system permease protein